MIPLGSAPKDYRQEDQTELRRAVATMQRQIQAKNDEAANAAKAAAAQAAAATNAADAVVATAQAAEDLANATATSAGATRVIVDLGLDPNTGRLTSGVDPSADIAGVVAGYVGKAQHGVFFETFEQLPEDWVINAAPSSWQLTNNGQSGGKALSSDGQLWAVFPYNIAYDPSKLYRIRVRMRQLTGAPTFYCGVEGIAADGVTRVNIEGGDSYSSQHYVCAEGEPVPADGFWRVFTGWFKGHGAYAHSSNPLSPSPLHPDVRYIRPLFIQSYATGGIAEIDEIAIDVLDEDAITRAYTAIANDGGLNRGASGSIAIETLAGAVGVDPLNMITNGGGQSGAVGQPAPNWTGSSGSLIVVTDEVKRFGDRSLKLMADGGYPEVTQDVTVEAGGVYSLSGWFYNNGTAPFALHFAPHVATGTDWKLLDRIGAPGLGDNHVAAPNGIAGWQFIELTMQVIVGGSYFVGLYAFPGAGWCGIDGVRLEKLPPNTTVGGSRAAAALDSNARLVNTRRMPMSAVGSYASQLFEAGTQNVVTTSLLTSNGSLISVRAFDAYFGDGTVVQYPAQTVGGFSNSKNYVFGIDANYGGGYIPLYAVKDPRQVVSQGGVIALGSITTTAAGGGEPTGPVGCVAPETPVMMSEGEDKPAADVEPLDRLWTMNETTLAWGHHVVIAKSIANAERWLLKLTDGRTLLATRNHRVFAEGCGWIRIDRLTPGDVIVGDKPGAVASCEYHDYGPVVKLTVEGAHTYISNGLASHNVKMQ